MTDQDIIEKVALACSLHHSVARRAIAAYHAELRSRQMKIVGREPTSDARAIMEYHADRNDIAAGFRAAWDAIPYPDETGETT